MKQKISLLLALILALYSLPALAQGEHNGESTADGAVRKVVYLTFDDGPKKDTPLLLALLEELDVPATFFLMGLSVRAFPEYAKQIVDAGYVVACHTMSHSCEWTQKSLEHVSQDIARFNAEMEAALGQPFATDLYRFPGGSSRYSKETKAYVVKQGYAWFDWNAMTGDAQYTFESDKKMYDYTLSTISKQENVVILLMHEGKKRTRAILPDLVAFFRNEGYEFRMLSTDEEERAILADCSANMMFPDER